jgi:hypothetical protein
MDATSGHLGRRSRRAGIVAIVLGTVVAATGLFLAATLSSDAGLLIGGVAMALVGLLMVGGGVIATRIAVPDADAAALTKRNDLLYLLVLVVGIAGGGACSLFGADPSRFALSAFVVVLTYSTFAVAQFNRLNIKAA